MLGTIPAFAYRHRETKQNLCRDGRSQDGDLNFILQKETDMLIKVKNLWFYNNLGTAFLEDTGSVMNLKLGRNILYVMCTFSLRIHYIL